MNLFKVAGAAALIGFALSAPALADGDAAAGEKVFKKCAACHKVGEGAKNAVGPVLNGVVGRAAGTGADFKYSQLNQNAGAAGLIWTEENILAYLPDPNGFLKKFLTDAGKADQIAGATKMTFKLADETERKNVIAYLKTFAK
ncbi:MAG: c-type cytochrome [Hyphomicrobiaceae bacterium]